MKWQFDWTLLDPTGPANQREGDASAVRVRERHEGADPVRVAHSAAPDEKADAH